MYITREIEKIFNSYLKQFKVVLVTGPRQVGKTTMLEHVLPSKYKRVSLHDLDLLERIKEDSALFFNDNKPPLVIDEIQYAPELFLRIKQVADSSTEKGTIVITGSQTFQLMKGVSDSLAGRVGILDMNSFSIREITNNLKHLPYIPSPIKDGNSNNKIKINLWEHIHRGSMPELSNKEIKSEAYYRSYIRTYIERDVRELASIRNERSFYRFMVACAARTGQLINYSEIAQTVGVDTGTVRGWMSILEASGIIHIMQPFYINTTKRLTKSPKLYFMDTGLVCYLAAWNSPENLKRGAQAGHIFETFVVSEILKSFINNGKDTRAISFYRDGHKKEIDILIQDGDVLHPVEIKMSSNPTLEAVKNFEILENYKDYKTGFGSVICQTQNPFYISPSVQAISVFDI